MNSFRDEVVVCFGCYAVMKMGHRATVFIFKYANIAFGLHQVLKKSVVFFPHKPLYIFISFLCDERRPSLQLKIWYYAKEIEERLCLNKISTCALHVNRQKWSFSKENGMICWRQSLITYYLWFFVTFLESRNNLMPSKTSFMRDGYVFTIDS